MYKGNGIFELTKNVLPRKKYLESQGETGSNASYLQVLLKPSYFLYLLPKLQVLCFLQFLAAVFSLSACEVSTGDQSRNSLFQQPDSI